MAILPLCTKTGYQRGAEVTRITPIPLDMLVLLPSLSLNWEVQYNSQTYSLLLKDNLNPL